MNTLKIIYIKNYIKNKVILYLILCIKKYYKFIYNN
jgi:hypothetical protein